MVNMRNFKSESIEFINDVLEPVFNNFIVIGSMIYLIVQLIAIILGKKIIVPEEYRLMTISIALGLIIIAVLYYFIKSMVEKIGSKMLFKDADFGRRGDYEREILNERLYKLEKMTADLERMLSFQKRLEESRSKESDEIRIAIRDLEETKREITQSIENSCNALSELSASTKSKETISSDRVLSIYKEVSSEFSHSIKTPLASIESAISNLNERLPDLLKESKATPDGSSEVLLSFLENASLSLDYIKKILQRGAGFFPGEAEKFSIEPIIRKAIRITREATKSPIEVSVSLGVPEVKYYWLNLLIPIIQVLENAFEALDVSDNNGKIDILCRYNNAGDGVEILISNNGEPIPSNIQSNIFEPTFSTKGEQRGAGLAIAKRCLETVNGKIELVQSDDEKTIFRILFTPLETYQQMRD